MGWFKKIKNNLFNINVEREQESLGEITFSLNFYVEDKNNGKYENFNKLNNLLMGFNNIYRDKRHLIETREEDKKYLSEIESIRRRFNKDKIPDAKEYPKVIKSLGIQRKFEIKNHETSLDTLREFEDCIDKYKKYIKEIKKNKPNNLNFQIEISYNFNPSESFTKEDGENLKKIGFGKYIEFYVSEELDNLFRELNKD